MINVGDLIRDQVPDKNGQAMPADLKTGAYQLVDTADHPSPSLYEGKVVTDKKFGHATYGCMICCGYNGLQLNPSPVYSVLYGSAALDAEGMDACGGRTLLNLDWYADPNSWTSYNTSVMTAAPTQVNGVGVGSANLSVDLTNIMEGRTYSGEGNDCPVYDETLQSEGDVPPKVIFSPSLQGIPQGGSQSVSVSFVDSNGNPVNSSPVTITLTLITTTGTGTAIFKSGGTIASGGASTQITSPTTVTIQGTTASSTAGNIKLDATAPSGENGTTSVAQSPMTFSVVSVSLSLQTSGAVAVRNPDFPYPNLGVQILNGEPPGYTACSGALQVTGAITPNDYPGPIYLRKTVTYDQYEDPGGTLLASASKDDTSDPSLEAISSGNVYELDSPCMTASSPVKGFLAEVSCCDRSGVKGAVLWRSS